MPISDIWPDVEASLEQLDEATAKRITSLHDHLLPYSTHIADYASSLHPHRLPCRLVTSSYTWGQSFLVYELVFEDPEARGGDPDFDRRDEGESWVARFGLPPYEGDEFFNTPEQLERKISNEVGALRIVRERTTVPVPTIFGYCARHGDGFNQKFGGITGDDDGIRRKPHPLGEAFPAFIFMSALRGKTIEDCGIPVHELGGHWDAPPASDDAPHFTSSILQNYLSSLASIHMQLSQVTFPQIGSFTIDSETGEVRIGPMAEFGLGPFDTAEEYYATIAEAFKRLAEGAQEEEDEDDEDDDASSVVLTVKHGKDNTTDVPLTGAQVRSLRRMFTAAIFPLALGPYVPSSNDKGPFPLRHGDLHSENILVDEETGNIVGIIDWEGAGTVPWEVAGGLNWEVQGGAEPVLEPAEEKKEVLKRPEIHSAFSRALKKVEADMARWFKPVKKQLPSDLKLNKRADSSTPSPPTDSISPSASAISLSSSSSSFSEIDSMKSHSRSSSSSKTNLTAFSSQPTSPASSMFELNKKEYEDGENVVWTGPRRMPSIAILNTPASPQKTSAEKEPKTDLMSLAKRFFRAASEPSSAPTTIDTAKDSEDGSPQSSQHSRSVSMYPVAPEAIREPLPADYHNQMVHRAEMSLSMAAMTLADTAASPPSFLHVRSPSGNNRLTTPTSSVFRSPPASSTVPRTPRTTLHKRRQSSMMLPLPLGLTTPVGTPVQSPIIPSLHLYAPQPFPPPPIMAASLSLPQPARRHGSASPTGTPKEHRSRSPSPLATPHAATHGNPPHTPHAGSHAPTSFSYGFPRTPTVRSPHHHGRGRSSWHEHEFGVIGHALSAHARAPSNNSFLPPSLSRSASLRETSSQKTITPSISPSLPSGQASLPPAAAPPLTSSSAPTTPPVHPATDVNGQVLAKGSSASEPPVKSPAGATLSEIHASEGAYVASYLAHFMFMFGCEYDTVGKALWDVVLCSRRSNPDLLAEGKEEKRDVDEAFWAWVKETLKSGLEEDVEEDEHELDEVEEVDEDALSNSDNQEIEVSQPKVAPSAPDPKQLDVPNVAGASFTVERVGDTPDETFRQLTVDLVANKEMNSVD